MKISKYQKSCIGIDEGEIETFIWNEKMLKVYEKIDKKNVELDKEGQSYHDFLEMEERQPNEEGTGRYKFQRIKKIQFVIIPKAGNKKALMTKEAKQRLTLFIQAYLRLPTKQDVKTNIYLKKSNLIDESKNLSYQIKKEQQGLDVYDLLDVFMEYRKDNTIFVGIIESQLQEEGDSLDGRACGDGVAVIAFDAKFQGLLQTFLHETLHTLGFDHCIAWKCLMNAWTNFESWLCPACSRKLYHELKLDTLAKVKKWMRQVILTLEKVRCLKSVTKGKQILKSI